MTKKKLQEIVLLHFSVVSCLRSNILKFPEIGISESDLARPRR